MKSRRTFVGGAAAAGVALATGSPALWRPASAAETLKVGFISPRTGPLGAFGEADPYVLGLARKALAGGVTVGGKTYAVEILDRDTQSDPARAAASI